MRIIELLIDKIEELTGFDAVALVEEPAIEADFMAFNNKKILDTIEFEVLKLAMKEHFESIVVEGKPLFDTIEEAERVAKLLGCEGHHEHEESNSRMSNLTATVINELDQKEMNQLLTDKTYQKILLQEWVSLLRLSNL